MAAIVCDTAGHAGRGVPVSSGKVALGRAMTVARADHTATLLCNGKILITGGFAGSALASTEIYDPETKTFVSAGKMSAARAGHSATRLPNGTVLISGGYNGTYLATAEIYDPVTSRFTSTGQMTTARSGHIAVLLNSGKVLLTGGVGTGWSFLDSSEIYDPAKGTFTPTGSMTAARESHAAALLKDGRVLIVGGHKGRKADITIYSSAELYDPVSGTFSLTGAMITRRHKHDATLLPDGRVLISGGSDERDSRGKYFSAEVYDPRTGAFSSVGKMNFSHFKHQGTSVVLRNGKVLIAGGASHAEIYDSASRVFIPVTGTMETDRLFSTATLLSSGEVLIAGGYDQNQEVSANTWLYKP
jgi:hypothetical protein